MATATHTHHRRRIPWATISRYAALIVLTLITLSPVYVMFATSFKELVEIQSRVPRWIFMPTLSNYETIITQYRFTPYLISSALIGSARRRSRC